MNKKGEIMIVDDDADDIEVLCDALQALNIKNKLLRFRNVEDALTHLRKTDSDPFLIFSDLRLPRINGFEFRQMIYADEYLIKKAVPFILFSTTIDSPSFNTALAIGVQGFFVKPARFEELQELLNVIYQYFSMVMGNRV
jgi:CheY-like chemotaxis protein